MTNEYKTLEVERRGALAIVSMNRPDKLNALSMQLINDLHSCFAAMCTEYKSRVIILRGAGRAFCAGADLQQLNEGSFAGGAELPADEMGMVQFHYHKVQSVLSEIILNMRRCPQPIIGAVRGHAVGGGFSLALACDVRIAAESARMNAGYIRIGLSGCDMGSSYFLPRIIGFSRAAEYLYTGRVIDASTADRFGLVSQVVPDDKLESAAVDLAEEMLQNSPFGLRMTKEAYNLNVDAPSLESAVNIENRNQSLLSFTQDHREGGEAMFQKRKAIYHDK
jgi:enoyl-CoA hydratase/carnithine racemase